MKFWLGPVRHNRFGFEALTRLFAEAKDRAFDTIEVDMQGTDWFDGDMCAAFGAILYRLGRNANSIGLTNVPDAVELFLSKNGFLSHYGRCKIPDTFGTTIPYQRLDVKDERYFAAYIEQELVRRSEMPRMSPGLVKKFRESVFEIFSNAVIHSHTKFGVFACGQYFPKKNRIDFSVADLGVGILQNVRHYTGLDLSAEKAILWALERGNTTKRGLIPGGLGLKLLRDFMTLNQGQIQIVSDRGYWQLNRGEEKTLGLSHPFPGTVVSIEIDTSDTKSYRLSTEPSAAEVF